MNLESIEDLVDLLVDSTSRGKLRWKEESNGVFATDLPKYTVAVWGGQGDDGIDFVSLQLQDKSGAVLDASSADTFDPSYPRLNKVFLSARRSANNVSEAIFEIRKELELR